MAIIPLGFTQFTWLFGGGNVPTGAVTTMGVEITNANGQELNAALAYAAFADNVLPLLTTTTNLIGVISKDGPNDIGSQITYNENQAGGSATASVPPNTALLVQKRTALGGRRNRGRMFIPGYREDQVGGNGEVGDPGGVMSDALIAFYDALVDVDMQPVVFHDNEQTPTPITALTLSLRVATQRRRNRR